jgi:DNA-binding NtrC family response regulator
MSRICRVLIAGGQSAPLEELRVALDSRGYVVTVSAGMESATGTFDVALALGSDPVAVCSHISSRVSDCPVVVVDDAPHIARTMAALRAGAADYLTDPRDVDAIDAALRRVLERRALRERVGQLGNSGVGAEMPEPVVLGESPAIRAVRATLDRLNQSDATVLVTGESGTGKEVVAKALHAGGARSQGPFVAVNCAALPSHLVEDEFFGHARGAFTDATSARTGFLVEATGGSLFLDEVSAMPLPTQAKLLRVIQERVVRPLGQGTEIRFDARILAACNVDLAKEVERGRFREDLFFRLNVVQVNMPPLRERGTDTLVLAQHFINRFAAASNKRVVGMTPGAAYALLSYDWPGNVRELQNWMEAAVAMARRSHVTERELPSVARPTSSKPESREQNLDAWGDLEARHIAAVLEQAGGNKARAARLLGIDRKTLYRKMRRYGMPQTP